MDAIEDKEIYEYCHEFSDGLSDVLEDLSRETHLKTTSPGMLSGPVQGKLLTLICKMTKAKRALEVGTFTGYAAICIALGLSEDGHLDTIELDEELSYFHNKYFPISGVSNKIKVHYGDANEIIPNLDAKYDLAFVDAGKKDYKSQFEIILDKMDSGGLILVDNVLWKRKVLEEEPDKITKQIKEFNTFIRDDERVSNFIMPIRDGINMILKK